MDETINQRIENKMMDDLHRRVGKDFSYYSPRSPKVSARHDQARNVMGATARAMLDIVPPGREQSMVLTKLEEAMFWANAGIARNQKSEEE